MLKYVLGGLFFIKSYLQHISVKIILPIYFWIIFYTYQENFVMKNNQLEQFVN